MLQLFKTYYLKTHVIDLSHQLGKTMTEMTKAEFEDIEESFGEEAIFVSHIAKKWKINENSLGKSELAQYKLGLERLQEFRQLYDLINNLQATYWESRALYLDVTRELATANCWSRRETTTNTYQEDVDNAVKNYVNLLKETEKFPEWNEKIKDENGYFIHMIYNSLCADENFAHIFSKFV